MLVPEISKLRACGVFTETSNKCRLDNKSRTKCNTSQCSGESFITDDRGASLGRKWKCLKLGKEKSTRARVSSLEILREILRLLNENTHKYTKKTRQTYKGF